MREFECLGKSECVCVCACTQYLCDMAGSAQSAEDEHRINYELVLRGKTISLEFAKAASHVCMLSPRSSATLDGVTPDGFAR